MRGRRGLYNVLLLILCAALFVLELCTGSQPVAIAQVWQSLMGTAPEGAVRTIITEVRLPQAVAALVAGIGLGWSGWLMQTLFRNPLAGPSVLGISSGASLGVALLTLLAGGSLATVLPFAGHAAVAVAAMAGAFGVLLIILLVSQRLADNTTLLVFGIMLGFFTSAIISVLQFRAASESVKSFVLWGMGSYSEAHLSDSAFMLSTIAISAVVIVFLLKPLNLMLLGDDYAQSTGIHLKRTRLLILLVVGMMVGAVTAFCGPVAFIGLVVPHFARSLMRTSEHVRLLVPVALGGAAASMLADWLSRMLLLPLNAVVSALGAPLILYIILRGSKSKAII